MPACGRKDYGQTKMDQKLIWVDLMDREVGYGEKMETHQKNILHRAFSVFLYSKGKILIQQRERKKYHSGGLWANSCCSHPRVGEEVLEAADRRMVEELGICQGTCKLEEIDAFVYFQAYDGLSEYEYDHVLVAEYEGEVSPNPEEIENVRWIDYKDLAEELISHPEQFSAWFLIAAPKVLRWLEENGR